MPKLSQNDQFKLLREELRELKDVKILKTDIRGIQKQLSAIPQIWEKSFFEFRSDLFNKIDGFVGRIKSQDEEIGTINVRVSRLEKPIQALVS